MIEVDRAIERTKMAGRVTVPDLNTIIAGHPERAISLLHTIAARGGIQYSDIKESL